MARHDLLEASRVPNLEPYKLPMLPMAALVEAACTAAVLVEAVPPPADAAAYLAAASSLPHRVVRSPEGLLLVTTMTELPGVSPAMVDWWFGWHLPSTERCRLWHPLAHRCCQVREDRSHLTDDRAREEMSHLGRFLPRLYADVAKATDDRTPL